MATSFPANSMCLWQTIRGRSCPVLQQRGYIYARHNGVRDLLAEATREISNDVEIEPHLQQLTDEQKAGNTSDEARLDLSGFLATWGA